MVHQPWTGTTEELRRLCKAKDERIAELEAALSQTRSQSQERLDRIHLFEEQIEKDGKTITRLRKVVEILLMDLEASDCPHCGWEVRNDGHGQECGLMIAIEAAKEGG